MSINKWLFRFIGFLVILVVITTLNSLNVFASVNNLAQPIASAKVIEVELNDDYFNPNVITIPINESTTLLLKIKVRVSIPLQSKNSVLMSSSRQEKKNITVKPNSAGTYELICRYHLLKGMEGKVIVK